MSDLSRRSPFPLGGSLFPDLDAWGDLFPAHLRQLLSAAPGAQLSGWSPKVDVRETPEAYEFHAELPGCKPEDIHVTLRQGVLTIQGEKKQEGKREQEHFHVVERSYGTFTRRFTLPTPVDEDSVVAETGEGVLTVKVGKSSAAQPKHVKVQVKK